MAILEELMFYVRLEEVSMLHQLINNARKHKGFTCKHILGRVISQFPFTDNFYEDSAILTRKDISARHVFFTADAVSPFILTKNYRRAGKTAMLIAINDIVAKGGTPICAVSLISGSIPIIRQIAEGLADGEKLTGIPVVGGHTVIGKPYCGVAMIGRGYSTPLRSTTAQDGDEIIIAIDTVGYPSPVYKYSFIAWEKPKEDLWMRWKTIISLADASRLTSGKDISMAGILGTLAMICEASSVGATIDLERIPRPEDIPLSQWVRMFQTMGFIFTCKHEDTFMVTRILNRAGFTARYVGKINSTHKISVSYKDETAIFWDFDTDGSVYGLEE
jgi:selenophosphate synthetase-related protein